MAFQFVHVMACGRRGVHRKNSTKRKDSMSDICDEMIRTPHACSHVIDPKPPNVVFGLHPVEAFSLAAERAEQAVDKAGRKLRIDALVVLVGVASWPELTADVRRDTQANARYLQWREATISWLMCQWGTQLKSGVEHMDEERPICTTWLCPSWIRTGGSASTASTAGIAPRRKEAGGTPLEQKKAYQEAMRRFQDDYYEQVAVRFGLTRLGPRRQRLSRSQWKEQKRQAASLAHAQAQIQEQISKIKTRARVYAAEKTSEANAAAQLKIAAITAQAHQRAMTLKEKAKTWIQKQDTRIRELNMQISEREATLFAKQEELDLYRRLLAEYGILREFGHP
jgi:DNA repair exonuclease SbcCD ATPase subunit